MVGAVVVTGPMSCSDTGGEVGLSDCENGEDETSPGVCRLENLIRVPSRVRAAQMFPAPSAAAAAA